MCVRQWERAGPSPVAAAAERAVPMDTTGADAESPLAQAVAGNENFGGSVGDQGAHD